MSTPKIKTEKIALNVERTTGPLSIPEGWSYDDVIKFCQTAKEREEQVVKVHDKIVAFPLDGALALYKALERTFGVALVQGSEFMGRKGEVQIVQVEVNPGEYVQIPWGEFPLPAGGGTISIGAGYDNGHPILNVACKTQRKYEKAIREIVALAQQIVKAESIYKGKALRLDWESGMLGGEFADVKFMHTAHVGPADLVFSRELERAIDTNLWTPIRHSEALRAVHIPLKRGVVLAGAYGTGKTLLATVTAGICVENKWTFLYVQDITKVGEALRFAQQYSPAMVFAEDVDRVAEERSDELNEILNTLDGIETKDFDVMIVLSTNHPEKIHPSMRRRGRTDVLLNILPPDAEAAQRLLRMYCGAQLDQVEDLSRVAARLEGQIPATIAEVAKRAKLEALRRTKGDTQALLVAEDVDAAAFSVLNEDHEWGDKVKKENPAEALGRVFGEHVGSALLGMLGKGPGRQFKVDDGDEEKFVGPGVFLETVDAK